MLVRSVIEAISDPKRTGLGTGRFITTRIDFTAVPDADVPEDPTPDEVRRWPTRGEPVATMRFRILKFLPPARRAAPRPAAARGPALTQDNAFWFEGARAHKLLIQRCTSCGTLRHPPLPACGDCRSLEWDTVESSGRGTLYSFVVVHYPQVPAFDYPLPIGLVELEEGTRVVANIERLEPERPAIGMALQAEFVDFDDELVPARLRAGGGTGSGPDGLLLHRGAAGGGRGGHRALLRPGRRPSGSPRSNRPTTRVDRDLWAGAGRRRPARPGRARGLRRRRATA